MILELIKQYRKVYKLTQLDAAKLLNVSRKRYLSLEAGKMTTEQAEIILNHFNKCLLIVEMSQLRVQNEELTRGKQGQNTPSALRSRKPKKQNRLFNARKDQNSGPPQIDTTELAPSMNQAQKMTSIPSKPYSITNL